jgi:hypothetical protein
MGTTRHRDQANYYREDKDTTQKTALPGAEARRQGSS